MTDATPIAHTDHLDGLNPEQRHAVEHFEGPLLVLAGAGSGKTRVLTTRIVHLIREHGVPPERILAVTFTNKAAGEMRERIGRSLGAEPSGMWMGTFHALGARLLRRHAPLLGWTNAFTIFDADQSLREIKRTQVEVDVDPKRWNPKAIRAHVSGAKNELTSPQEYLDEHGDSFDLFARNVARVYPAYQASLKDQNAFDFDDLLVKPVELFLSHEHVLKRYRERFAFILVDEYQDTNHAQFRFLELLAREHGNLMVVGDDDQCVLPGTAIATPGGETVPVERVRVGQHVTAGAGRGRTEGATVAAAEARTHRGPVVEFETVGGRHLRTTPNHLLFARLVVDPRRWDVVLMEREDVGFRIGVTRGSRSRRTGEPVLGLAVGAGQERADRVWVLATAHSEEEARLTEARLSLRYGIPATLFHGRGRRLALSDDGIRRLNRELDTPRRAERLMDELVLFPEYPHELAATAEGHVRFRARLGRRSAGRKGFFDLLPAAHLRVGMEVPVLKGGRVVADPVSSIRLVHHDGLVHDLEVVALRNYFAGGICVHNSIYGWRGADIRNILDFEKTFPGARVVRLERNYRSTTTILEAANRVIAENVHRKGKTLRTERTGGEAITLVEAVDENDEGRWIVEEVRSRYEDGPDLHQYRDFAVLYRTNAQSRALEDGFRRAGVPYQIVGGVRFYERREIQDVLGYLRLISNPSDRDAFDRVANYPRRGVGPATMERLATFADRLGVGLLDAAERATGSDDIPTAGARSLERFADLIQRYSARAANLRVGTLLEELVEELDLLRALREEGPDGEDRAENVKELIAGALDFDAELLDGIEPEEIDAFSELDLFLQRVALVADIDRHDPEADTVTLMTLHNAKGLEFPVVFIAGLEDGLFPLSRAYDEPGEMEEERRLFYVGITRSQDKLYLSHARQRRRAGEFMHGRLTHFVEAIPEGLLEVRQTPALERMSAYSMPHGRRRERPGTETHYEPDYEEANQDAPRFVKGERVVHGTFGSGSVVEISGFGRDTKVTVDFETVGRKKLLVRYAGLEKDWDV